MVTVCTADRKPILANEEAHALIRQTWIDANLWLVGKYVLMPEHLHLLCSPTANATPLETWVTYWKRQITRGWRNREDLPLWQVDFWDTQLRREESYAQKSDYIGANPVRRGLAAISADWAFQGEIYDLGDIDRR